MEIDDDEQSKVTKKTKKVKTKAAKLKPKAAKLKPKAEPERICPKEMMRRHLRLKSWAKRTALKMKDERDLIDELNRNHYKPTKAEMLLYRDVSRMKLSDSGSAAPTPPGRWDLLSDKQMMQPAPAGGASTSPGCNMFQLSR